MRTYTRIDPAKRFEKFCMPITESGCVIWLGSHTGGKNGKWNKLEYGTFMLPGKPRGRCVYAHRFAYESQFGTIPEGKEIDHLCKVTLCVNHHHLEAVDRTENNRRSVSPSALNGVKERCKRGHILSADNLYEWRGHRICRTCQRLHKANSHRKHHEKNLQDMRDYYIHKRDAKVRP